MSLESVVMPKLGMYMEDVLLSEWLVAEGAEVKAGQVLFVLETDKVTAEVEAEADGWLHRSVEAGVKVPIGERVGVVATTRDEYDGLLTKPSEPQTGHPFLGYISRGGGPAVAPGHSVAAPPAVPGPAAPRARISPRARALLGERGIRLEEAANIVGTGADGRVTDRDVGSWLQSREAAGAGVERRIPLRGVRGAIASRMLHSLQTSAQLTSVLELDATSVVELRRSGGAGYTAIFVKLVAAALRRHPLLNSRISGDQIELLADVNVAVAVDTEAGVVAPVVRGADRLSLVEVDERVADLAARARAASLALDELEGATFTLSNGGVYPVDITTAILVPPQSALLWLGRIRERPLAVDGEVVVRPTLQACLTYDHRAVDGAPAAAFLATLQSLVGGLPSFPALPGQEV
jgi:pyruvate/2-oxoglutarate dehydrogenase complex dihydrolipoamide acyltransferase (E2) component